jgi:hypothetical protein
LHSHCLTILTTFKQQETDSELADLDEDSKLLRKKRQIVASTEVKKGTVSTKKSKRKGKK